MLPDYDWSEGCTFKKSVPYNPIEHLYIVFAHSPNEPHLCMVTFVSRVKAKLIPASETRLYPGDHQFICEESFMVYKQCETWYYGQISPSIVEFQPRLSPAVLQRIQSTCLNSIHLNRRLRKQYCSWKGIAYFD